MHSICGITHNIQICQKTELNAHCSTFKQNLSLFSEALFIINGTSDPEVECYEMKTSFLPMLSPQLMMHNFVSMAKKIPNPLLQFYSPTHKTECRLVQPFFLETNILGA